MKRAAIIFVLLVATAAGTALDFTGTFWTEHPFLTSLLVNLLTLLLAVAAVEWWLERRRTRAWYRLSAVAYDGLINAVRGAWIASLDAADVPIAATPLDQLKAAAQRIDEAIAQQADDAAFRVRYANRLQPVVDELGQAIRNWAAIMTTDDEHAGDIK